MSLPLDVSRSIEELLDRAELDFVHVHEPFAPSAASAALRHSRALNVGTFHSPTERFVSTQVARPLVERLFGRLDGRTAAFARHPRHRGALLPRQLPGDPARAPTCRAGPSGREGPPEIVFSAEEERGALRLFLRALRKLPDELDWTATVWLRDPAAPGAAAAAAAAARPRRASPAPPTARRPSTCRARASPWPPRRARRPRPSCCCGRWPAAPCPVASRLPQYEEVLDEGELGLLFEPRDAVTLAAQLERLLRDERAGATGCASGSTTRTRSSSGAAPPTSSRSSTRELAARRHSPEGKPAVRKRLRGRDFIHVDLHMHTDHSHDCATPVDTLLAAAKDAGLGAIAVTDHNEVSGAHEAREKAGPTAASR